MKVGNKEFIFPFSLWIEVLLLKELGEFLKEARENNGVSIEEASDDLKLSPSALDNIESGNTRAFNDMFVLKNNVRDYAKYLGLDPNQVLDEFNDFLFEHTSKISLDDILEAQKKIEEKEDKKVKSPYTKEYKLKKDYTPVLYIIIGVILLALIVYIFFQMVEKEPEHSEVLLGNKEAIYEFTY